MCRPAQKFLKNTWRRFQKWKLTSDFRRNQEVTDYLTSDCFFILNTGATIGFWVNCSFKTVSKVIHVYAAWLTLASTAVSGEETSAWKRRELRGNSFLFFSLWSDNNGFLLLGWTLPLSDVWCKTSSDSNPRPSGKINQHETRWIWSNKLIYWP